MRKLNQIVIEGTVKELTENGFIIDCNDELLLNSYFDLKKNYCKVKKELSSLDDILKRIETADDYEINEIMAAVRRRFARTAQDWEVVYLSYPKNDPVQRKQTLEMLTNYFDT